MTIINFGRARVLIFLSVLIAMLIFGIVDQCAGGPGESRDELPPKHKKTHGDDHR